MPRSFGEGRSNLFGKFIRKRRNELGLLQRELAAALKVTSPEFVGLIEAGQRMPNFERIPDLAAILQTPVQELLRLAFADAYPSLVNFLLWTNGSESDSEASNIGIRLYSLPHKLRDPIVKMINKFWKEHRGEIRKSA